MFYFGLFGQTLENTYLTDYYGKELNYSFKINDELKYYTLDRNAKKIYFYDASHSLIKTTTIQLSNNWDLRYVYLPTDKLFNTDSKIEFLIESRQPNNVYTNLTVFNEDGTEGFTFELVGDFKLIKTPQNTYKILTFSQIPVNNGKYEYKIYSLDGTLDTSQEHLLNKSIVQFPNPTSKNLHLKNIDTKYNESLLEIYSIDGKIVLTKKILQNETQIDVSNLSKGVYYYKIGEYSNKFIKE